MAVLLWERKCLFCLDETFLQHYNTDFFFYNDWKKSQTPVSHTETAEINLQLYSQGIDREVKLVPACWYKQTLWKKTLECTVLLFENHSQQTKKNSL